MNDAATFQDKYNVLKYIKTVGVYLRRSRGDIEKDLVKHSEVIYNFIHEQGWQYVEYKEIGSGSSITDRTEIKYLLRDVKEGLFDAIIVHDYDRLGRGSATDQETIQKTLRMSDTLVIAMNPFEVYNLNSESDEEMIDFKGFLARREYKMITKRMQSGKKIGARLGNWVFGKAPFGYSYNAELKSLEVDPVQKELFREIIDKYLGGYSLNKIASQLNDRNIPSPRNKRWHGNSIKNIITNEVYLGNIVSNKSSGVRLSQNKDGTKKPYKLHPKDEWIIVKNCHEALITEDEIMKIKELLRDSQSHKNGNNVNHLSGIVKCGICNHTMTIQRNNQYVALKKCANCGQNKGGDSQLVTSLVHDYLKKAKEYIGKEKNSRNYKGRIDQVEGKINDLRKQIMDHNSSIKRIQEAYEDGLYDKDETRERMKERRDKISDNNEEIRYLSKKRDELADSDKVDKLESINTFYEKIKEDKNRAEMNELYKLVVRKIVWTRLDSDNINIKIYLR